MNFKLQNGAEPQKLLVSQDVFEDYEVNTDFIVNTITVDNIPVDLAKPQYWGIPIQWEASLQPGTILAQ